MSVTFSSAAQPENIFVGILTISESIVTVVKEVQPAKTLSPKLTTFSGIVTVSREIQFIKAYSSTVVFVLENVISFIAVFPEKAFLSMLVTLQGNPGKIRGFEPFRRFRYTARALPHA